MRTHSIITTCERPGGKSYYQATVNSLLDADFWIDAVVKDANPRLGIVPTYRRALQHGVDNFNGDRFIIFQDDVIVARGLREWIEDVENIPGVMSLYTPADRSGADGWQEADFSPTSDDPRPWLHSVGGCALLFPYEVAKQLVEMPPPIRTDRLGAWIGEFCYNMNVPFWFHNPSLVQHIGHQSVRKGMPMTPAREASRFCPDVEMLK